MTFKFNKDYARPIEIKRITPNGIIYFKNGRRALFKVKDIRAVARELPPLEIFDSKVLQRIQNKMILMRGLSHAITGRIIYNLYYEDLMKKLESWN